MINILISVPHLAVMPGLVPGIQASTGAGASGTMDPGDTRRDDCAKKLLA
jgi:hypothetical protein